MSLVDHYEMRDMPTTAKLNKGSLVDHDEMRDMPTTAKLNKGSVQLQREVELNADAVAEGIDTCETVSVIDQRVAHLSSDASAKPELIVKDSSGGGL
ncbi:unnamed protein product, partial [Trichobilharzia regenti]